MRECFESEHKYRDLEMPPFMEAIVDGDYSTVSRMLEEGASPSDKIALNPPLQNVGSASAAARVAL